MKKPITLMIVLVMMVTCLAGTASATSQTVNHWWTGGSSFKPTNGSMATTFTTGTPAKVVTNLHFTLNSANLTAINNLKAQNGWYFGMDIKDYPAAGSVTRMDAYALTTTMPNPKIDLETNWDVGDTRNEAEVVALGDLSATTYNMRVQWDDWRQGSVFCYGGFYVNAEMSMQFFGIGDYQTMDYLGCMNFSRGIYPGQP